MKKILLFLIFEFFVLSCFAYSEIIGKEVILKSYSKRGVVYLGIDKKSFNCAISNLMGNERNNYLALLLNNKVFEIPSYTKAKVLDIDFYSKAVLVKILDGTYKDKIGWVLMQEIIK